MEKLNCRVASKPRGNCAPMTGIHLAPRMRGDQHGTRSECAKRRSHLSGQKPTILHKLHAKLHNADNPMVGWDNLKVLLAISRFGSLTAAGQFLGIDQSTVGRKLSALEAELGAILFVRSKAGFAPTQAGEAAIKRALEMEIDANALIDDVATSGQGAVGTVRLLGNAWTLDRLTQLGLSSLLVRHPKMDVRIITLSPRTRTRGEASVSLWFEVEPRYGEFAIELGVVPYAIYKSIDAPQNVEDWVIFYDEDANRPAITTKAQKLRKPNENIRLTATDASVLVSAVASGIGKGLLPMCLAEQNPRLVRMNNGPPELQRMLKMHVHPDTIETERLKVMIDWLREVFDETYLPVSQKPAR